MNKNTCIFKTKAKLLFFLVVGSISFFFFFMNSITPLIGEDFALLPFFPNEEIKNGSYVFFIKILLRIKNQMEGWNVRIGEQLSIVFGGLGKPIFNILNTLMTMYFLFLIELWSFKTERSFRRKIISISLSFVLIILFQPTIGEIFFWQTGSTNYLWGLCLLLTFLLPLRYYYGYPQIDLIGKSIIKNVLFCLLGFFAGITNENTVGAFWIIYLSFIVLAIVKKKRIPIWFYSTFLTFSIGLLFMLRAPSTAIRISYYNEAFGIDNLTIIDYLYRAFIIIAKFFYYGYAYVIVTSFIFIMCLHLNKEIRKHKGFYDCIIMLLAIGLLSCGALILSPYVETRAFFLTHFLMLVCCVYYLNALIENTSLKKWIIYFFVTVSCIFTLLTIAKIYSEYSEYYYFCQKRDFAAKTKDKTFYWGEYYKPIKTRILNTRENYVMANPMYIQWYYNKDIDFIENSVWDLGLDSYSEYSIGWSPEIIQKNGDELIITGTIDIISDYHLLNNLYLTSSNEKQYINYKLETIGDISYSKNGDKTHISIKALLPDTIINNNAYNITLVDRKRKQYAVINTTMN